LFIKRLPAFPEIDNPMGVKKHNRKKESPDSEYEEIIIRGIIIPAGWDEKGNIIAIAVSTFDEDVYHIENDDRGNQLMPLIREEVEIKGTIRYKDGIKKIRVDKHTAKKGEGREPVIPRIA
jgi:hypothetical protein